MNDQINIIADDWLILLGSELIMIPLVFGLAAGFIISISPQVKRMKRRSDRAFYVYIGNAVFSGASFIAINYYNLSTALSMLIFVMASSVIIPYIYYSRFNK